MSNTLPKLYSRLISTVTGFRRIQKEKSSEFLVDLKAKGGVYELIRVKDYRSKLLADIAAKMLEDYGEDEATDLDWMRRSLRRTHPDWYFGVKDGDGKLIGYSHSEILRLNDSRIALYLCYLEPEPMRLALIENLYEKTLSYARNYGLEVAGVVIEADEGWGEWCEKAGLFVPCAEKDGLYREVPYYAPSMAWTADGKACFEEIPNHLKMWMPDAVPDPRDFMHTIRAIYEQFVKFGEFESNEARQKAKERVSLLYHEFGEGLIGSKPVLLPEAKCLELGDQFIPHEAVKLDNERRGR